MKRLVVVFFAFVWIPLFGQTAQEAINQRIDSILDILSRINEVSSDSARIALGERSAEFFREIMLNPGSWLADLSALKHRISILESSDHRVKVFTWAIPLSDDFYYIGFVQYYDHKSHTPYFYRLIDKSSELVHPEKRYLRPDNWYGAVYYDLLTFKYRRKRVYVLLGTDPANSVINRKIIEFMTFRSTGPRFGYDIRDEYGRSVKRLIFEYNNQASMLLEWNKDLKMIVFDHLSPSEPKYKGLNQFYGPDFSYDALKFQKGKFIYLIDVDVRDKNLK